MRSLLLLSLWLAYAGLCGAETRAGDTAGAGYTRVAAAHGAHGMEFDVFIRLQNGMSEGELLLRAGKPDSESVENLRSNIVKTYYYFPTTANPWITTITLRGGRIVNIDRVKKIF